MHLSSFTLDSAGAVLALRGPAFTTDMPKEFRSGALRP